MNRRDGNATVSNNANHSLTSNSSAKSSTVPEAPVYLVVSLTILFAVIFLLGVAMNVLVTAVVLKGRTLRTSVNYFLVNLCAADLLVIVVCMPTAWVDVYAQDVWYFGEAMCKFVPYLENVVAGTSVITILFICIERYKAICQPLHRSNEAMCRVIKIVTTIWIMCSIISLPFAFFPVYRNSVWTDGTPIKVCRHPIKYSWQKPYLAAMSVVFFLLPFLILLSLYCRVGRVLAPRAGDTSDMFDESYREKMRQRRQGINIIASIVIIFFVSHLPYRVVSLWLIFESQEVVFGLGLEKYLAILYAARIAFYLNHALNPILYNFVSRKFRAELRWLCYPCKCRLPRCASRDVEYGNSYYRSSRTYSPAMRFRKTELLVTKKAPKDSLNEPKRVKSSISSEKRQFRNDFSGLYASIHADESNEPQHPDDRISEIQKHFSGQIACDGAKKHITSFRLLIRSTSGGFAFDVDLKAKRAVTVNKEENNGNGSSKMTYI